MATHASLWAQLPIVSPEPNSLPLDSPSLEQWRTREQRTIVAFWQDFWQSNRRIVMILVQSTRLIIFNPVQSLPIEICQNFGLSFREYTNFQSNSDDLWSNDLGSLIYISWSSIWYICCICFLTMKNTMVWKGSHLVGTHFEALPDGVLTQNHEPNKPSNLFQCIDSKFDIWFAIWLTV